MPIFWTQAAHTIHLSVLSILCALFTLFPQPGFALEISTPVGLQQIGKPLNLKSTLSKVPAGAESQLRSTCLKAKMYPLESAPNSYESELSREVLVQYEPTIRRGGLLEFRSVVPVNDAVVEMELVSECPLVVFSTRWTLIMKEGVPDQVNGADVTPVSTVGSFDPSRSNLLASSRKPPPPRLDRQPAWMNDSKRDETKPAQQVEETTTVATPPETEAAPVPSEPVDVASLDKDLMDVGLIESQKQTMDTPGGLGLNEQIEQGYPSMGLKDLILPLSLGLSALLMTMLLVYRKYFSKKARIHSKFAAQVNAARQPASSEQKDLASISKEHVKAFTAEPGPLSTGSPRVLESLFGDDGYQFDSDLGSSQQDFNSSVVDPVEKSSLKISLEMINRADIPSWKLPPSYLSLVESRNKSLEQNRTLDALLLRSQIGLVELAFQDAKQGRLTNTESSLELLEQVLGEQCYELESKPSLGVPDVVKSYVRAKMCEISGAEKRQLLRENLVNLNNKVISPSLCFRSNMWREFLSEEGILE